MSRYYRKRKNYRNKQNIRLFIKILLLPITLIILLIKLFNKNSYKKQNNSSNENLNFTTLGKKYNILKYIFLSISISLFILFFYIGIGLKIGGYICPILLLLGIATIITYIIFNILSKKQIIEENELIHNYNSTYHLKEKTITNNEKYFLDIIKNHFNENYEIRFQVPLSSIIEKEKEFEGQYQNELNRIIDIGIFDKNTTYPLLLIEINDNTHHRKDRQIRDAKVKNICEQANIKLIAFWTEYSNTEEYIINKINENLGR